MVLPLVAAAVLLLCGLPLLEGVAAAEDEVVAGDEAFGEGGPAAEAVPEDELQAARVAASPRAAAAVMPAASEWRLRAPPEVGADGHGMTGSLELRVVVFWLVIKETPLVGEYRRFWRTAISSVQIPRPRRFAMRTIEVAGMMPEATARAR